MTLNHVSHKTFTLSTPKGSGTASRDLVSCRPVPEVHPEYTEGTEGGQRTRFWARLEGPAAWAFGRFCDTGGLGLGEVLSYRWLVPSRHFVSWYTVVTHKILRHRFETFCDPESRESQNLHPEYTEGLRHRFETHCDTGGLCLRDVLQVGKPC